MRAKDTYLRVSILSVVIGEIQYLSQRRSPERDSWGSQCEEEPEK